MTTETLAAHPHRWQTCGQVKAGEAFPESLGTVMPTLNGASSTSWADHAGVFVCSRIQFCFAALSIIYTSRRARSLQRFSA